MAKLLKWLLVSVGLVVFLLAITVIVLPKIVDPTQFKDEISAAVFKKTGRELVIGGEIEWTVFPAVGLNLSDVSLGNIGGFGDQPMLDIGQVAVSVKLLPLFARKIEIGEVSMADVSLNLLTRDGAKGDQQVAGEAPAGPGSSPSDQVSRSPGSTGMSKSSDPDAFVVSGIEISNANVSLKDIGETTELEKLDLIASNIEMSRPFGLKGSFTLKILSHQVVGDVIFDGLFQPSTEGKRFAIQGLKLSFKGQQGLGAEALTLISSINTNAFVDLVADKAMLSDFSVKLHNLTANGDFQMTSITDNPQMAGQLSVAEFNPKSLMKALGMEVPQTGDANALTSLKAEMNFTGSGNHADMQGLTVNFDKSVFLGRLRVDDFDQPRLAFDFQVDQLNLDDYMSDTESDSGSPSSAAETDLLVDDFRGFTGGGDFSIGELIVAGLKATDVRTTMKSSGEEIRFYPVNASFYGGQHEGDIRIDASGARPILKTNQGITGVQAENLLTDLSGTSRLKGTGDFFLQIQTDLSNSRTFLTALSGDMGMSVLDGAVIGIDIADTIGAVKAALGKQAELAGRADQSKTTEFAELSMTGVFEQGILRSDDLLMQSTLLRATGEGSFNLVEDTIDYVLKPVLLGDQVDKSLAELNGVPIPIRLTGNLYEPDMKVDILAVIAGSQKDLINEKANDLIGKLLGRKKDKD